MKKINGVTKIVILLPKLLITKVSEDLVTNWTPEIWPIQGNV
jgi:hypothetical protein